MREEDPGAVRWKPGRGALGHLRPGHIAGKRILHVGCGCGASTMNLVRLFPESGILGVELDPASLDIARSEGIVASGGT
jgi:trans-aconitate methyltransferase